MNDICPGCGVPNHMPCKDDCPRLREHRALETTLEARANKYGDFADVSRISQNLLTSVEGEGPLWDKLSDTQKEGVKMILHKIARAVSGDPNYKDNWHDIAGYAKLVEDRCADSPSNA